MQALRLTTLSLVTLAGAGCTDSDSNAPPAPSELSANETAGLVFTREEEKLARDVYSVMTASGPIFDNIQNSEQQHFDAIGGLLVTYGLEDPSAGLGFGEFQDGALQTLYQELLAHGAPGGVAALEVGCTIEELDLRDLDHALSNVEHADIAAVYDNLARGSRNHLRAFYGNLTAAGGSYAPIYIDQATFDAIVTTPREQGAR